MNLFLLLQPKSAQDAASQKAWQDAEKVWVVHKAGFSGGRVQRIKSEKEEEEDTAICKVKLDHGGEVITIEEESIEKVFGTIMYSSLFAIFMTTPYRTVANQYK